MRRIGGLLGFLLSLLFLVALWRWLWQDVRGLMWQRLWVDVLGPGVNSRGDLALANTGVWLLTSPLWYPVFALYTFPAKVTGYFLREGLPVAAAVFGILAVPVSPAAHVLFWRVAGRWVEEGLGRCGRLLMRSRRLLSIMVSMAVVGFYWRLLWLDVLGPSLKSDPRMGVVWVLTLPIWYMFLSMFLLPYKIVVLFYRLKLLVPGLLLAVPAVVVVPLAHMVGGILLEESISDFFNRLWAPPTSVPAKPVVEAPVPVPAVSSPAAAEAEWAPQGLPAVAVTEVERVELRVDPAAFDGLVGVDAAVGAIKDALELPLLYPEKMKEYALKPPRGVLFYGPPGTGKTSLARATAKYFGCSFFVVNASELVGPLVGAAERSLKRVFQQAKQGRPSVIFFDELDAIGRRRDGSHLNRPSDLLLNLLLAEMDGFDDSAGVFVIGATNRADVLDEALLRPGRFDRLIEVGLPGRDARVKLFALYLKGRPTAGIDLELLSRRSEGMSPAQIRGICDRAAVAALKRSIAEPSRGGITNEDLLQAMAEANG